ncbi:MAG: hypothetical protein ACOC1F_10945 [Myxococcota bacterium]
MITIRRAWTLLVVGLALSVPVGCGKATGEPRTAAVVEPAPVPKDAAAIAREVVQARIGAVVRFERLRGRPVAQRIVNLGNMQAVFEGTGIDLLRDASVAFIASTGITTRDKAVVVVRHELEDAHVQAAIERLMARSDPPGQWLSGTSVPAARVVVRGQQQVLAVPSEGFLVVMPSQLADQVDRFAGPLELSFGDGPEAAWVVVDQPSEALRAHRAPRIPASISQAEFRLQLRPDGGADLSVDGKSTSPEQAAADAAALARSVDAATTVKVSILRVRFFRKIPFRSEGDRVKSEVKLSPKEVNKLLTLAEVAASRSRR